MRELVEERNRLVKLSMDQSKEIDVLARKLEKENFGMRFNR